MKIIFTNFSFQFFRGKFVCLINIAAGETIITLDILCTYSKDVRETGACVTGLGRNNIECEWGKRSAVNNIEIYCGM